MANLIYYMELKELRNIGLTDGEIKVYSALLELGECTKTLLAKKSGISPSNIYDVTNRLLEKGIISRVEKNGVLHFKASSPKQILNYISNKKREIESEENIVKSLLPNLLLQFNMTKEKTNVEVFYGWNGMNRVFEELLSECNKGDENFVFGASKGENNESADRFFIKYSKLREEKGIITNIIFNEEIRNNKEKIEFLRKSKKYNIRFLQQSTPAEITVYRNKCCIFLSLQDPIAIRITSKEAAENFKQYFDVLWRQASK